MKILLVIDSIPFPADNGKELPLAEIFSRLSEENHIDLLVVHKKGTEPNRNKLKNIPASFGEVMFINFGMKKFSTRVSGEITGKIPGFFSKIFDIETIKQTIGQRTYDLVWTSPFGNFAFVECCLNHGFRFFQKSSIGLNDVKTNMYRDSINEAIGFGHYRFKYIAYWLRSFLLARSEGNYLSKADFVHVQTEQEKKNALQVIGSKTKNTTIIVAPNGIKEELLDCSYQGINANKILYMTHLSGGRKHESRWFITKVWPEIKKQISGVELILVGAPANENDPLPYIKQDQQIVQLGFVDDLKKVFNEVRMAVIPIFHGTGLINRLLDAIIAGVPCVATSTTIRTLDGLQANHDVLAADNANDFAKQVVRLYNDEDLRKELSDHARQYAVQRPNWEATAMNIFSKINNDLSTVHSSNQ